MELGRNSESDGNSWNYISREVLRWRGEVRFGESSSREKGSETILWSSERGSLFTLVDQVFPGQPT